MHEHEVLVFDQTAHAAVHSPVRAGLGLGLELGLGAGLGLRPGLGLRLGLELEAWDQGCLYTRRCSVASAVVE